MPKCAQLPSPQPLAHSFMEQKKQALTLEGRFALSLATGEKRRRISLTIAPSFISIALKIFVSTSVILQSGHAPTWCTPGEADNENTSWQK